MDFDLVLDNISNNIKINENKKEKLIEYASLVIDYNKNVNIIDIGSGSGLPSIPLAIVFNDKRFTLCESKNKKAEFLRLAKDKLELNNIEVKCINAYEIKEKYDTITSRAFSDIATLLKIFNKLKTKNSKLVLYKGKKEKIEEELKEANIPKNKYNIEIKKLESKDKERHIVIISSL